MLTDEQVVSRVLAGTPALGADQAAVLRDWLGAGAVPQRPPT